MAITITGLTAAKMLAMENATVTGGYISIAGNLILTTVDGTEIDCGSVIGPQGDVGPTGDVSVLMLDNAIADAVNTLTSAEATTETMLATGSVTHTKLGPDAVEGDNIADNAVNSEHYVDGSIDAAHLADNSVDSRHYVDGSIDAVHLSFIIKQPTEPAGIAGGIWFET